MNFDADTVKLRLNAIGYEVKDSDEKMIELSMWRVDRFIKNDCNVDEIPEGLHPIAVNMVIGEFLAAKKALFPDDLTTIDLNAAVSQIQEGDTSVTFSNGDGTKSTEERLDELINLLLNCGKTQFACYRRLRW